MMSRIAGAYHEFLDRNRFTAPAFWFMIACGIVCIIILIFIPWNRT